MDTVWGVGRARGAARWNPGLAPSATAPPGLSATRRAQRRSQCPLRNDCAGSSSSKQTRSRPRRGDRRDIVHRADHPPDGMRRHHRAGRGVRRRCRWRDGVLHVFCPHTTAGVTINESADPDVRRDLLATFDRLVPARRRLPPRRGQLLTPMSRHRWRWRRRVPLAGGALRLGTWQTVYLCEFDGPCTREIWLQFVPAAIGSRLEARGQRRVPNRRTSDFGHRIRNSRCS